VHSELHTLAPISHESRILSEGPALYDGSGHLFSESE
jgi:hypothetical protein